MTVLIVAAVEAEIRDFVLLPFAELLLTGIGPVEAAIAVSSQLAQQRYDLIINVGVAGGFEPHGHGGKAWPTVGTGVVVTREHYVDLGREDRSPLGLPPGVTLTETVACDQSAPALLAALCTHAAGQNALWGAGLCSATVTTSDARALRQLEAVPGALVESMEGFAVARAAALFNTPHIELRGLSNRVGDRAKANWDLQAGIQASHTLLHATLALYGASSGISD